MDGELAELERKLATLIAHTRALRAANDELRAKLGEAQAHERALDDRMRAAAGRLDALISKLPAE